MRPDENTEPLGEFRIKVELDGVVAGWFTECSGLSVEREVEPYAEGGVNSALTWLPGGIKRADIVLQHGVMDQGLWQWFQKGLYDGQVALRSVSVILYAADGTVGQRWDLPAAFPARWSGPIFKAGSNRASIETLQIAQGGQPVSPTVQMAPEDHGRTASAAGLASDRMDEPAIDLQALATKVYALLCQEARVEAERTGRRGRA